MKKFTLFCSLFLFPQFALAQTYASGGPVFGYVDFQGMNRRVSLQEAQAPRWEKAEAGGAYAHQATRKTFLSPAAQGNLSFELPFDRGSYGWAGLGVFPAYDSYVSSVRVSADSRAPMLPLPSTPEAFDQWEEGDSLYWKRDKGIGLYATIGAYGVGGGPRVILAGSYQVYLEKKAQERLYIEVRPGTVRSAAVVGGVVVAYGEGGVTIERYLNGQGFLLEPKSAIGAEAFKLILQGRFGDAQALLASDANDGNMPIAHVSFTRRLGYTQWAVSTPFIPVFSYSRRTQLSETEVGRDEVTGASSHSREVEYTRGAASRALRRFVGETRGVRFFRDAAGKLRLMWRWDWESTTGGPVSLSNALARMRRRLDCGEACQFETRGTRAFKGYTRAGVSWEAPVEELAAGMPEGRLRDTMLESARSADRNDLRRLAQAIMGLRSPLAVLFGGQGKCVDVDFQVAGYQLKQWKDKTALCPSAL